MEFSRGVVLHRRYRTSRLIPSFRSRELKLISKPRRLSASRRYVSCASVVPSFLWSLLGRAPDESVQRHLTLCPRNQRERLQDVLELFSPQLVELSDPGVQTCQRRSVASPCQEPRERSDFPAGVRRGLGRRDRELLHRRRCYVRRDAKAYEVVDDEAVEEAAEEMLQARTHRCAQAEDGVGRCAARGQDRRDERQAIRGAGYVPVSQARMFVPIRSQ